MTPSLAFFQFLLFTTAVGGSITTRIFWTNSNDLDNKRIAKTILQTSFQETVKFVVISKHLENIKFADSVPIVPNVRLLNEVAASKMSGDYTVILFVQGKKVIFGSQTETFRRLLNSVPDYRQVDPGVQLVSLQGETALVIADVALNNEAACAIKDKLSSSLNSNRLVTSIRLNPWFITDVSSFELAHLTKGWARPTAIEWTEMYSLVCRDDSNDVCSCSPYTKPLN